MAALHASSILPSRRSWAPPRRQDTHSGRQGSLCVRAGLFGGVTRFFGGGPKEEEESPAVKLSSSTSEDVRRLVQQFDTSDSVPRLSLSHEEVQLRISALLSGADADASRKAKSASAVLEQLADAGGSSANRLALAAAQDELRWSQVYTSTLDTNQARAEALIRGFSEADVQGLISRFVDASLTLSDRTTSRVLSSPAASGPALLATTPAVIHRRSVTAHAVGASTRDGRVDVVNVGGWIDSDSRLWDTLDEEAEEVGRQGEDMAQLPTA